MHFMSTAKQRPLLLLTSDFSNLVLSKSTRSYKLCFSPFSELYQGQKKKKKKGKVRAAAVALPRQERCKLAQSRYGH